MFIKARYNILIKIVMCDNEEIVLCERVIKDGEKTYKVKFARYDTEKCKECKLEPEKRCKDIGRPFLDIDELDAFDYESIPQFYQAFKDIHEKYEKYKAKREGKNEQIYQNCKLFRFWREKKKKYVDIQVSEMRVGVAKLIDDAYIIFKNEDGRVQIQLVDPKNIDAEVQRLKDECGVTTVEREP